MKTNLIDQDEREKAEIALKSAIEWTIEHDSEEPYFDFEIGKYDGSMEPILVAIVQALRQGAKIILDLLTPEEKAKLLQRK